MNTPEEIIEALGRGPAFVTMLVLEPLTWKRPAVHTEHGRYSLFLMCRHLALHDRLHAYRIEEILLSKELLLPPG